MYDFWVIRFAWISVIKCEFHFQSVSSQLSDQACASLEVVNSFLFHGIKGSQQAIVDAYESKALHSVGSSQELQYIDHTIFKPPVPMVPTKQGV